MISSSNITPGTVYLVGAGPGDPGLITVRAVQCMEQADLVLYDYLVNPILLEHAATSAELICLGRHGTRTFTPEQIVTRLLDEARKGRTVVRLKGGDPSVFGRGADEVGALREAGIPYEIVPGITAGLAAAAYCEIPVTHHEDASAVAFIAGQERHCKATSTLNFDALAKFPGTIIFYMGVTRTAVWSQGLIDHGKNPETPVAIVRRCSWARQKTVRCTLGTVVGVVQEKQIRPPSLFIVGDVVNRAPDVSWFADRPIFGARVLVAGPPRATVPLRDQLSRQGADVITQPSADITPPTDWQPVDAVLERIDRYQWLVVSDPIAAERFVRRLLDQEKDLRWLGRLKVAAVGSATAECFRRFHLRPDVIADRAESERTLAAIARDEGSGPPILLVQIGDEPDATATALAQSGRECDVVSVGRNVDVSQPNPEVAAALSKGLIDWVAATSPRAIQTLARLYGTAPCKAHIACIDPATTKAARDMGYTPVVEAKPPSLAGLADAIRRGEPVSRTIRRVQQLCAQP